MAPASITQISEEITSTRKLAALSMAVVRLDPRRPQKTLDFGADGVICSIGLLGDITSLSAYHSIYGIVTANPFEQFPGDKFWDSGFVRGYRQKFLRCFEEMGSGFGLRVSGDVMDLSVGSVDGKWPRINYRVGRFEVESSFIVADREVVNTLSVVNESGRTEGVDIHFGGQLSVNRASYGQLTEAGPIPMPPCLNQLRTRNGLLTIHNPNLPATFACSLYVDGHQVHLSVPREQSSEPIHFSAPQHLVVEPWGRRQITAICRLGSDLKLNFPHFLDERYIPSLTPIPMFASDAEDKIEKFVVQRTLDYIVSCCCIPIEDGAVCVLTDHIALPLGWHRDN